MSFVETLVILLVAVIVFGPKRLPEVARKVGKVVGAVRRAGDEFKHQLMTMDQQVTNAVTADVDQLVPTDETLAQAFDFLPATPYEPDGSLQLDEATQQALTALEQKQAAHSETSEAQVGVEVGLTDAVAADAAPKAEVAHG